MNIIGEIKTQSHEFEPGKKYEVIPSHGFNGIEKNSLFIMEEIKIY